MSTILVTDGEQRSALAAVRSLGRAGHTIYTCSARERSLAGVSRYCSGESRTPDPLCHTSDFVDAVHDLAGQWKIDLILPISEPSLLALLPERVALGEVRLPFPGRDEFERICDKGLVTEVARSLGIGVPAQHQLTEPAERDRLRETGLQFPLVLKSSRSVVGPAEQRAKTGVVHVADEEALTRALDALPAAAYPLLVQERIDGPGVGVFLLLWEGELIASFAHRRIREKPPSGGVSVQRESIPLDSSLLRLSRALLERFGWQGVAMVEYKVDQKSGVPYLMEVNGRLWGSLQLAIDAGVDFPRLLVAAALGEPITPVTLYHTGVRSRWWWGDVDHLVTRFRRSRAALSLPENAPGRTRTFLRFLSDSFDPHSRNEVFRFEDPRPSLQESVDWLLGR